MMNATDFARLVAGARQTDQGNWTGLCAGHDDSSPSLSWRDGRRGLVVKCHAGCDTRAVIQAMGLAWGDVFGSSNGRPAPPRAASRIVAEYDYTDERGTLLFQAVRFEPKSFRQRRPGDGEWIWNLTGVRLVPYNLLEISARRPATLYIPEGEKDVEALASLGVIATTNPMGAGKWKDEYSALLVTCGVSHAVLLPHNDTPGREHQRHVKASLEAAGITTTWLALPDLAEHGDVADWIAAGGTREQLDALVTAAVAEPVTIDTVHGVFRDWLGDDYDLQALDAVLATAASQYLGGDPCWLLVIGGSGSAKTETLMPLVGAGAVSVSTITSTAALLSGTARRERATDATGGLLRRIGASGLLVIKDVTSILSMDKTTRATLLAALREIHDGKWDREIGSEGGRVLSWTGRLTIVGASTGAWDRQHEVVATMGDRFLLVRVDSRHGRASAAARAQANIGREAEMRESLANVVTALMQTVQPGFQPPLTPEDHARIYNFANLLALARTPVETDYREDVVFAHAPEMPTRVAKQLYQLIRGATALGLSVPTALDLATRVSADSIPPLRRAILDDLTNFPRSRVQDIRRRIIQPYMTVKRAVMALEILRLVGREGTGDDDEGGLYYVTSEANMAFFRQYSVTTNPGMASEYDDSAPGTPLPQTHYSPVTPSDVPF